ncbi:AraC family L-rhamnose operon transcriptional activator RhaR [Thermocatellispora tengchongensis]|uniref:AraC family L-rhamnose operon transcriptional activator RhaR n=1 Tax=Thermocatellispora tengchongensis TaxID=1073253 RepID=A0A840PCN5_9ACTN|nr:AraC family transcriptional regulator [Thermocatellispora tengchongensis]MBB5136456.1 AraC family L-rhamnose operon transcriptional activator RhaR [Thermocatellispora tengchongensis]
MRTSTLRESDVFGGGPVSAAVHALTGEVEPHGHDFLEVAVVGPGSGGHVTSRGERAVREGEVIVLRPGAWHGFTGCRGLTVANCCVSAGALRAELAVLHDIPALRHLLWTAPMAPGAHGVLVTRIDPAAAADAIEEIARLAAGPVTSGARIMGRLLTVLGTIADALPERPVTGASAPHPAVRATLAALELQPAHPWTLAELAGRVSLDPGHLGRLFRRHTGLPPLAYLARVRAERAAALLATTTLPAARVGAAVGWDDPTYFARRFRALAGLTPTEYRRRASGG